MNRISKKAMTTVPLALIALLSLGAIPGCSRNPDESEGKTYITVKGSDTMVHLASTWAESFMEKHPDIEVSVTGGGSGTGIAALLNGTTDLCAASREIKQKELQLAQQKGLQPQEFVAARDGIAVIVNHKNPVSELTLEQLEKIFTGDFERWNQAGGSDEGILVLSRESSSGTYVFFQERVLQKKDYTPKAKLMPATSAIIQSVSSDQWTIGYVGLGYAQAAREKVKIIAVKTDPSSPAVLPSDKTVSAGDYLIARPLYLYTNGTPKGTVKNFIDFCLSESGQNIVRDTGYVTVK